MLSRTADSLYWIARYMERAENLARILQVTDRLSLMPSSADGAGNEWHSTIVVSDCEEGFYKKYNDATPEHVISYLAFDPDNPSSIRCCIESARRNARSVRTALTTEQWESLNATWLDLPSWKESRMRGSGLHKFLDWVKDRSLLFHGGTVATMLRRDSYHFMQLGTFIERGDNTARILDVKYHVLLPDHAEVGGGIDYYQWASILRAVSGYRSYHVLYKEGIRPWLIADFLIMREEMPRSLLSCTGMIKVCLDQLAEEYGQRHESHRMAGQRYSQLRFGKVADVFSQGLHDFLTQYVEQNNRLGAEISRSYLM
ncbi:MAG: alpha-E domain-containing protein [Parvibaculum sp.]|uniref:alpha-E domain-containing protein n=1 Tax=Parvibaculum sp. TaxID=2024848 RepID=UPI0025E8022F|nr:alpha-E domain-containing protein [Parvibaculum sp.]MCE9648481.1 alpha-E domain-containing protein [Parvibaculum sp.]